MSARQFSSLRASSLYCRDCGQAQPVREKLLLVLPDRELYEYDCGVCGATVGSREVTAIEQLMERKLEKKAAGLRAGPQVRLMD